MRESEKIHLQNAFTRRRVFLVAVVVVVIDLRRKKSMHPLV